MRPGRAGRGRPRRRPRAAAHRDEAFERVHNLIRWHAARFIRIERAGYGTTAEEFVAEATVWFCRSWHTFDGIPHHLNTFAKWAAQHAAKRLRRQNRAALGVSLDAFENPGDLVPAPRAAGGLEPDELDRLRAALAELPERQRDEVVRYFGIGRHRQHSARELTVRWGGGGRGAAGARIRNALDRLAASLTNS